jgi:hypothetical protein
MPAGSCTMTERSGWGAHIRADGAIHVVAGAAWSDVSRLEFPVFSEMLSIVVA